MLLFLQRVNRILHSGSTRNTGHNTHRDHKDSATGTSKDERRRLNPVSERCEKTIAQVIGNGTCQANAINTIAPYRPDSFKTSSVTDAPSTFLILTSRRRSLIE